jgi:copper chaperone NosL
MEYIKVNGEDEIGAAYIKDAAKNEWIDVFKAVYVYNKDYWTPMNYGVVALDSKEAAQEWMTTEGEGQLLAYKDLHDFKWGIHK